MFAISWGLNSSQRLVPEVLKTVYEAPGKSGRFLNSIKKNEL
jgi:hypothetical protein